MTQNQIAFAAAVENERHNRANETLDLFKHQNEMAFKVWERYRKEAETAGKDVTQSKTLGKLALAQGRRVAAEAQSAAQLRTLGSLYPAWYDKLNERNAESNTVTQFGRRSSMSNSQNSEGGRRFYD